MPGLNLNSKYNFVKGLVMSPSTLLAEYLHGIPLFDTNGSVYPIEQLRKKILDAQTKVENFIEVKMTEREITSTLDYILEEWLQWGHLKLPYTCNELLEVKGTLSNLTVIDFNIQMFVIQDRNLALVPGRALESSAWVGRSGTFPVLRSGVRRVPNFWQVKYKTGFKTIPIDVLSVIGKLATIAVLGVMGDVVLPIGLSNESLSFDGLSQSFGTTRSGTTSVFSARMTQYANELKEEILALKHYYRGIVFTVV